MFGRRFPLLRIFGFQVQADAGGVALALVLTWLLAFGVFPTVHPGLSAVVYATMGILGSAGLFASIVLHEVSHAWVARRDGLVTRGITLWMFGGVAETTTEPATAPSELRIALAGPAFSLGLAGALEAVVLAGEWAGVPLFLTGLLGYLAWTNLVLALFNLLPGFPLDGGRVFRALIWRRTGDLVQATRIATAVGIGLGVALIVSGVFLVFSGNAIGGVWWVLIGAFLHRAAHASREQVEVRQLLTGVPVHRIMERRPAVVPAALTVERFVQDYAMSGGRMRFPVEGEREEGRERGLVGYVDLSDVRPIPQAEWPFRTIGDLVRPIPPEAVISPEADGAEALRRLHQGEGAVLFVVAEGRLEGLIALQDLARALHVRSALGATGDVSWWRPRETPRG